MFRLLIKLFVFVFLFISSIPAQAESFEYMYVGAFMTKNDRAFRLQYDSLANKKSLHVYSFPDLVELNKIDLSENYSYATVHDLGLVVYSSNYIDQKVEDSSSPNLWVTTVTNNVTSYDLNLTPKGNLIYEEKYTYELYDPEYLDLGKAKTTKKKNNKSQCVFKKQKNGTLSLVQ